jgi:hypothetical protein
MLAFSGCPSGTVHIGSNVCWYVPHWASVPRLVARSSNAAGGPMIMEGQATPLKTESAEIPQTSSSHSGI